MVVVDFSKMTWTHVVVCHAIGVVLGCSTGGGVCVLSCRCAHAGPVRVLQVRVDVPRALGVVPAVRCFHVCWPQVFANGVVARGTSEHVGLCSEARTKKVSGT
jgi:hypothetical protein